MTRARFRHWLLTAATLLLTSMLFAQDEPIRNWAAPLYWQPSAKESAIISRAGQRQPEAPAPATAATSTPPLVFVAVTPCRMMDTRGYDPTFANGTEWGPPALTAGATRTVRVAGITAGYCSLPATAQAVSVNVTLWPTPGTQVQWLTLWPAGQTRPAASTINDYQGTVFSPGNGVTMYGLNNAAIVPLGSSGGYGAFSVYVTDATSVFIDVNGYYVAPSALALGAGTAAAPSLSFTGDSTSGLYSSGAGTINVSTSGSDRLTVTPNGNVGIGTTAPAFKLDVVGQINANNPAATGFSPGVSGTSNSPQGAGVSGYNTDISGTNFPVGVGGGVGGTTGAGINGSAGKAGAVGVNGFNGATTGYAVGVAGSTASNSGAGVNGNASVAGAIGVNGFNSATTGYAVGVQGGIAGSSGAAVQGNANGGGGFGVSGLNFSSSGGAVGVQGASGSPTGIGILGQSMMCSQALGCLLVNGTALALHASSNNGGVLIKGLSGLQGTDAFNGTQVFLVDGQGNGSYAGNLAVGGNLSVTGTISKGGGSFRIDHPLDPENRYLYHSFVESPDMKNIYDGVAVLDERGEAVVTLPGWFEALNQDFRYQLTCVGGYAPVYVAGEVSGNRFRIAGGRPGLQVSWQITGIRHDDYANAHRIPIEEVKPPGAVR